LKKILILVNHDIVIYNFRLEIVERLLSEGYKVIVSSPYGKRIDDLIDLGCEYIETPINRHGMNPLEDLKLLFNYIKIIKRISPFMIFSFTIKPNIYGGLAARIFKVPYIANITGLGTAVEKEGGVQKLSVALYKQSLKAAQCIFLQNEENKEFFINNNIFPSKLKLIPGSGVNLYRYPLLKYPESKVIEFVFISRIMKEKGIDQYLEAASNIKNRYPNTRFHVCGFCEDDYDEILKEYESKGIIKYHGMVSDISVLLKKIHCTVHPSYYPEGISNVLLESAASGKPLITTNRSGCREVVDDGINGYLVEPKNTKDLISKIEWFLKVSYDKKMEMGLQGRKKVESEFNRNFVVAAYMEELDISEAKLN
jgi:glycosyltransferase involved in cell wall biosynthesis